VSTSLSCAAAPPLPVTGGGVASPIQAPVQGGGTVPPAAAPAASTVPASPVAAGATPAPTVSTVAGATMVQPAVVVPVAAPVVAAPIVAATTPAPGAQPAAPPLAQAAPAAVASVQPGPAAVPQAQAGAAATGGGPVACTCSHGGMQAYAAGAGTGKRGKKGKLRGANGAPAGAAGGGTLDGKNLKVKGQKMSSAQRKNIEAVLKQGQKMGASRKVLETAVATVIQESNAENIKGGDRDSVGLFQQRPSMGWGSAEQVGNPKYAAKKFFEKAIPADKKDPGIAKTALAQSVQKSAFPDAYAQWDKEAETIVSDYLG